jgi:predicted GIY-YIG superfamily endonuclease
MMKKLHPPSRSFTRIWLISSKSKFVRSWRPFELVKTIPCRNAKEARKLEYDLKSLTRKKKIEVLELQTKG